ncbi:Isovalerate--CoA ligase aae2 [Ranunculus cassubicifolius]
MFKLAPRFQTILKRIPPKPMQRSQLYHYSEKPMEGLLRCSANDVPLSPISFLERAASVYRDTTSIIHGSLSYTWSQTHDRCLRIASALSQLGVSTGDVVAVLSPNVPAMYELQFGVPMAGAVLCNLNTRYDAEMVSRLLAHSEAKVLFVDYQLLKVANDAFKLLMLAESNPPLMILISDSNNPSHNTTLEYESLLASGHAEFKIRRPKDEWEPISLNYTSGTTSSPKGVVYTHRGSYLNTLSTILLHNMGAMPTYLWTVPMFHCNGWCLAWGLAAQGGTNICLRKVTPKGIYDNLTLHKVTHMGGAPTVLNMIVNSSPSDRKPLPHKVEVMTGGSPPPPQILFKMEELGFNVSHLYGLTETYGPGTVCTWKPEWDSLPPNDRAKLKSRQGQQHLGVEVDVKDPVTLKTVPPDGKTMGEVMFRGNTVMKGYLKNLQATREAFDGGWFRSGDLAVKQSDGYIKVKDRSKDIIISGGENISSIEVETVLYNHPAILEAAVVGRPDNHWGETPCAFVKLKEGCSANEEEIIMFCRDRLPHYMAPRSIVFDDVPKTSTGKVQKYLLRKKAKDMGSLS